MHPNRDRRGSEPGCEVRERVDLLYEHVEVHVSSLCAVPAKRLEPCGYRPTGADHVDTVDSLLPRLPLHSADEECHLVTTLDQSPSMLVREQFRPTCLRVTKIPPIEDQDAESVWGGCGQQRRATCTLLGARLLDTRQTRRSQSSGTAVSAVAENSSRLRTYATARRLADKRRRSD